MMARPTSREEIAAMTSYVSRVTIERLRGGVRRATLPIEEVVFFGVHDEVAEHYGKEPGTFELHSATLDYLVAAAGG
jgi:hypothetical protein